MKLKAFIATGILVTAIGVPTAGAWKCNVHPEKPNCTGPYPTTTTSTTTSTVPETTTTVTTTTVPTETSSTSTVPPFEIDDVGPDAGTEEEKLSFTG